jgi:hypothetical protein
MRSFRRLLESKALRFSLATYALATFLHFAHYAVAPVSAHSLGLNVTIWLETSTALLLLSSLLVATVRLRRGSAAETAIR